MSAHSNSDNLLHLYEGDQSKLYSGVLAHHGDESSSKKQVRRIMMVTLYLAIITTAEVLVGLYAHYNPGTISKVFLAFYFLGRLGLGVFSYLSCGGCNKEFVQQAKIGAWTRIANFPPS